MTGDLDVVCLGEVLVDFVPDSAGTHRARPGGAPANVAAGLASLGHRVGILCRTGDDGFGRAIAATLLERGVSDRLVQVDRVAPTSLAVVAVAGEEPPFALYRQGTADGSVVFDVEARAAIRDARLLHLGSLLGTSARGRRVIRQAFRVARRNSTIVSVDVNLRRSAWSNEGAMIRGARSLIRRADVVKVTVDETRLLGLTAAEMASGGKLWLITDGERGATAVRSSTSERADARATGVVETTGAGDASFAAFLDAVLDAGSPAAVDLASAVDHAVHAGALAVQVPGAMVDISGIRVPSPN